MREHQLEKIMYDYINGEIDVLVSTTIIEGTPLHKSELANDQSEVLPIYSYPESQLRK